MSYFAEIENGIVKRVIVASQEFIDSGKVGDPKNWVETKKNDPNEKYAGIGDERHEDIKAFVSPKPFESWILDTVKKQYKAPVEMPLLAENETAKWNEKDKKWDKVVLSETLISK